jgi:hypothetical protein
MRSTSIPLKLFATFWRNTVQKSLFPLYQYEKLFCFSYFSPHRRNSSPLWQNFPPLWLKLVRRSLFPLYRYEELFCFPYSSPHRRNSSPFWQNFTQRSLLPSYQYEKLFCLSYPSPKHFATLAELFATLAVLGTRVSISCMPV